MGAVGVPFLGRMPPLGIPFTLAGLFGWRSIRLVPLSPFRHGGCILAWSGQADDQCHVAVNWPWHGGHVCHPCRRDIDSWRQSRAFVLALWRPGPGQLSCQGMFACIRSGGCNCHLEQRADSKLGSHHRPDFHCGFGHDRGTRQFSYSRLQQHAGRNRLAPPIVSRHRDFCR